MLKRSCFFCFCAIMVVALTPLGVSYWSEDINLNGLIRTQPECDFMLLQGIGALTPDITIMGQKKKNLIHQMTL